MAEVVAVADMALAVGVGITPLLEVGDAPLVGVQVLADPVEGSAAGALAGRSAVPVDFWAVLHLVGEITAVSMTGVFAGGIATFLIDGFGILMGTFSTSASGIQIIIPIITRTRITTPTRITITRLI
jgi:hypothetical protein